MYFMLLIFFLFVLSVNNSFKSDNKFVFVFGFFFNLHIYLVKYMCKVWIYLVLQFIQNISNICLCNSCETFYQILRTFCWAFPSGKNILYFHIGSRGYHLYKNTRWSSITVYQLVKMTNETNEESIATLLL